jgi:DNA-binding NarL/FixJ family response regulator
MSADGYDVIVTDRVVARLGGMPAGNRTVLVCDPTPFGAKESLAAVSELVACAVVCADAPGDLDAALRGAADGRCSIPMRVLDLASEMPLLTERQLAVLSAVVAGETNSATARASYLSLATVKREMAALYSALGASSRPALSAAARSLGVPSVACGFHGSQSEPRSVFR